MKHIVLAVLLLLLSSCSTEPTKEEKQQQEQATHDSLVKLVNCGVKYAPSVDDGISDAQTVALALSMRCNDEYELVIKTQCDEMNGRACEMLKDRMYKRDRRIEQFIGIVMLERQNARNALKSIPK